MAFRVAYVLLWFPEPSQTFILDEINTLRQQGLDLEVYTLYGPRPPGRLSGLAPRLAPVFHLGTAALGVLLRDLESLRRRWGPQAGSFLPEHLYDLIKREKPLLPLCHLPDGVLLLLELHGAHDHGERDPCPVHVLQLLP